MNIKKRYLLFPFIIGLFIWLNGIISDPFSVPFQDYASMPTEQKQIYGDKSRLMRIHRTVGLSLMGVSFASIILMLLIGEKKQSDIKESENVIKCVRCNSKYSITELFPFAIEYKAKLNVVIAKCPHCDSKKEIQILSGKIIYGYIYAAGEPHYCGMEEYSLDDLVVISKDPFKYRYNNIEYIVKPV